MKVKINDNLYFVLIGATSLIWEDTKLSLLASLVISWLPSPKWEPLTGGWLTDATELFDDKELVKPFNSSDKSNEIKQTHTSYRYQGKHKICKCKITR
jgi:hypothetical protein